MKKALFFMIFIFATAICGYAQEASAAEQNDDSELISRYQNRRTMRGYKMLSRQATNGGCPTKKASYAASTTPTSGASARRQASNSTISYFLAAAPISNCTVAAATPI